MSIQLSEPLRRLEDLCSRPETPAESRSRRGYLALCFLILSPTLAGTGLVDLAQGRVMEAVIALALAVILAAVPLMMSRLERVEGVFRVTNILAAGLGLYMTAIGGGDGLVFVWFYTTPLIVFFLFGGREGLVWLLVIFTVLLVLFFGGLGTYVYDSAVSLRFLITFGVVVGLGYGLETSRRRHYDGLMAEKISLEKALADVKTLSRLLPICAACKSVRDDQGYWNQIETFVQQHSEARFLRGLCPDCRVTPSITDSSTENHALSTD